jgi:hypothetical protein
MSNPVPFLPKSEARSPSMEVDKGRVVRGAANCRVGTASLVPGVERPRGRPLEKAAKREEKGMGGKMARENWGHRRIRQNQATTDLVGEAARRRSHRKLIVNVQTSDKINERMESREREWERGIFTVAQSGKVARYRIWRAKPKEAAHRSRFPKPNAKFQGK